MVPTELGTLEDLRLERRRFGSEVPKVPVFAPTPPRCGSIPAPSPGASANLSGVRAATTTDTRKLRAPVPARFGNGTATTATPIKCAGSGYRVWVCSPLLSLRGDSKLRGGEVTRLTREQYWKRYWNFMRERVPEAKAAKDRLLALANEIQPRLVARGGGVRDIEVRELALPGGENSLVVHLLVDTCDAMGANLVNTICEAVAPELAALADGEIAMSILSNLADHSVITARVRYPLAELASSTDQATATRDAILRAGQIAQADPYRAATNNKGIMNGIDALAIATGNDWRAIEAGAPAFAAKDGHYRSSNYSNLGQAQVYDAMVLRDGKISYHFTAVK